MEQRAGTQTARVDLILDIGPVSFNDDGALKVGELQVAVYCGDAKEKVIAESKVRWILRASDDILADWLKDGIQRSLRVPVKVKPKFVKVVVYDPGSDRTGSISLAVK
jgi:hypothetical protein